MRIDPHVHCRDGQQAYKETIAHVFEIAESQGVDIIFDMPNTEPPILDAGDVEKRLSLVPPQAKGRYFLYVGLTASPSQNEMAINCWHHFREVIGLKMFARSSVGPLAIVDDEKQKEVYKTLVAWGYDGVLAVHCEREADCKPELWKHYQPASHSLARPKEAEINSVRNQINFARETGFSGILHICHVSCSETVDLVKEARKNMRITCGVTPHHLIFSNKNQMGPQGLFFKVDPPLRSEEDIAGLFERLRAGEIDWIESDHAPHTLAEKFMPPYLSGMPSLYFYQYLVECLLPHMEVPQDLIEAMTFKNIWKVFSAKLDQAK